MIVQISESLQTRLQAAGEQRNLKTLQAEIDKLQTLTQAFSHALNTYERAFRVMQNHLTLEERQQHIDFHHNLRDGLESQRGWVQADRRKLAQALQRAKDELDKRSEILRASWPSAAREEIKQYLLLVRVLGQIGELRAALQPMQHQLAKLGKESAEGAFPASVEEAEQFFTDAAALPALLAQIPGLNEAVAAFLIQIVAGNATLAGLNEAVFAWCRQHGEHFKIIMNESKDNRR